VDKEQWTKNSGQRTVDKEQWTVKTLVREAVNCDSPEATKEKGILAHGVSQSWLYRFEKHIYT